MKQIDEKLLNYIPKKNRNHIKQLWREHGNISFCMEWEDGFQRSRMADNIAELKDMIDMLEEDRNARF